jgi:hypothetical protein
VRLTIATYGSEGDTRPFVALCRGLLGAAMADENGVAAAVEQIEASVGPENRISLVQQRLFESSKQRMS